LVDAFDIFNSHKLSAFGSIVQTILKKIVKFYEKLSCYIKSLKLSNGQFLIHSTIKNTRFLGIMIAIKNVIDIFRKYVEDLKLLNFVSCYKLNQNHLELFFSVTS